jgi:hypothetical protein
MASPSQCRSQQDITGNSQHVFVIKIQEQRKKPSVHGPPSFLPPQAQMTKAPFIVWRCLPSTSRAAITPSSVHYAHMATKVTPTKEPLALHLATIITALYYTLLSLHTHFTKDACNGPPPVNYSSTHCRCWPLYSSSAPGTLTSRCAVSA